MQTLSICGEHVLYLLINGSVFPPTAQSLEAAFLSIFYSLKTDVGRYIKEQSKEQNHDVIFLLPLTKKYLN